MSPRLKRQELRRAAGYIPRPKPYAVRPTARTAAKDNKSSTSPCVSPSPAPRFTVPNYASLTATLDNTVDLGMPTSEQYARLEEDYITLLNPRKREKALITQDMFDMVWAVLHDPGAAKVGSPQFRWWVRKMFVLSYPTSTLSPAELASIGAETIVPVVLHQNRPVALKDQIYEILCYCHQLSNHAGRDKTTAVVREHYSWIPKELVSRFVKVCPTCINKKSKNAIMAMSLDVDEEGELVKLETIDADEDVVLDLENVPPSLADSGVPVFRRVALPISELVNYYNHVQTPEHLQSAWPPGPGPAQSSLVSHPVPSVQWPESPSRGSRFTYRSRSPPMFASDIGHQQASTSSTTYGLPLMQRFGSMDYSHDHRLLHPAGQDIVLPPLTQILSQESRSPNVSPVQYNPGAFTVDSSVGLRVPGWQIESQNSYLREVLHPNELVYSQQEYLSQIDPILLHEDYEMSQGRERRGHVHLEDGYAEDCADYRIVPSGSRYDHYDLEPVLSFPSPAVTTPKLMRDMYGYGDHIFPPSPTQGASALDDLRPPILPFFGIHSRDDTGEDDMLYEHPSRFSIPVSFERRHAAEAVGLSRDLDPL